MNALTRSNRRLYEILNCRRVNFLRALSDGHMSKIVQSKIPKIDIQNVILEEYMWQKIDKWHDKTATVCAETGRKYSYSDIYMKSKSVKNVLIGTCKLKPQDTAAIILPNVPEYPIVFMGSIQAGLKVTTMNPIYTSDEIQKQIANSETKIIFTLTELWPKVHQAIINLKVEIPIVVIDHFNHKSTPGTAIKFEEFLAKDTKIDYKIQSSLDDVIIMPYSSGTTGVPKGVELTNKSIVSNLQQMQTKGFKVCNETEGSYQEVIPAALPIFHIYGLVVVALNMLSSGCKLVTLSKFSSQSFINILREHKPHRLFVAPPIALFLSCNSQVTSEDLSSVETIMSGAAPLGASDVERLNKKSTKSSIIQGYGMTEASPLTHIQTSHFKGGIKNGGCGLSIPETECKIVALDGDGSQGLGPNQTGELLIRGPQLMKGYYKNEQATRDVLHPEGWLKTGDVAYYDEDGQFFIVDRLKELIKVKGYQVAPAELEEVIRCYPDVEDVAVIGVPHSKFGEVPKAFIVPKKDVKVDSARLAEFVSSKVSSYKQLDGGIKIVDQIPKNPSGKILRRLLKDL